MDPDGTRFPQGSADRGHRVLLADGRAAGTDHPIRRRRRCVSRIEPGTDAQLEEIIRRYLSGDAADKYLEFARNELGEHVAIYLQPQHWLSSDMGSF